MLEDNAYYKYHCAAKINAVFLHHFIGQGNVGKNHQYLPHVLRTGLDMDDQRV